MSYICFRPTTASVSLARPIPRQFVLGVRQAQVFRRPLSTPSGTSTPPPPPPPPPHPELSRWRRALQTIGRVTLITIVTSGGVFYYTTQKDRHPGPQLPYDPSKKNVVVVGSGWASTAFLKNLDTSEYNVTVISPRNFFLFTPLLPSVAVGTLSSSSILQPIRYLTRHKDRKITVIEAEAKSVDPTAKTITFADETEVQGEVSSTTIPFDYLVYAVGAETQTFGIPGVKEHACFMKEIQDAEKFKRRFMDCVESAGFPGQSEGEIERLLHMVVVGGGPTGIEVSGELHDFLEDDLKSWYPELSNKIKITLIEALPSVLSMFSRELIDYTVSTFKESKIDILTDKSIKEVPVGLVVWAGGNKARNVSVDLMSRLPDAQKNKRGITVDDHLRMAGTDGTIFALGDCTSSQVYLARVLKQLAKRDTLLEQISVAKQEGTNTESLEKQLAKIENLRPFHYSHQGSLAYIGSEKAIADLEFFHHKFSSGGVATFLFWRSAYLSTLFSLRNRVLVATDWLKVKLFGRDLVRD
ncbi:FAD/NAD-P-binding domain-containing protein [Lactifluus subvellereus]|nr:FAD/NAD-P-binding domain-containing protein [Lactifluus subvellereus]